MRLPKLDNSKGMLLEGIFSSELVDSSGEVVSLEGMDISSMEEGKGVVNWEHLSASDGAGKEVVGKVIYVKKIFKASDCDNDSQRYFFRESRYKPYLYGIVRLFDAAGHHEAQDLAAQIRDYESHDEKCLVGFSIEGSTIEKEGNYIKSSIARRVALTVQPANKGAIARVLLDPTPPEGFDKIDRTDLAKQELFQDPNNKKVGRGFALAYNPIVGTKRNAEVSTIKQILALKVLQKAITAGSTDVAPSSLTGGAALQKEDLGRLYTGSVLAAARDYSKPWDRSDFKKYLKSCLDKAQLPDVSDSFLDHFADIAEAWKLKKSVDDVVQPLRKNAILASPSESVIEEDRSEIPPTPPKTLTFRGKKVRPNPAQKGVTLDAKKGVLKTPMGSFKLHNPATEAPEVHQHFMDLMNSPHTHKIMSEALAGWHRVHQLNKAGELPEEVPLTATILSTCSGNRPVPLTELQTVRIVDAMRNSGMDIRQPGFEKIMPHLRALDKPDVLPEAGKEAIGKDPAYYIGNKIGVERGPSGEKLGEPNEAGRFPGELKTISPLLADTIKNLSQYYKVHGGLMDLIKRHKTDMASGIQELMDSKNARQKWNTRRAALIRQGKPDPGEYKGMNIPGIKLKTGLYAYGMMGGSGSIVPDTHFIRHMVGLDTRKDASTLLYLKKLLWDPKNYHVIQAYNDWYRKNHPAFKWMANHPEFSKYFDKPEDATFPAFWANWINIAPYERKLGTSAEKQAKNTGSTHAPYWAAIEPAVNQALKRLGKSDSFDSSMPLRAALIMQHYVRDYGEIPAQLLYYAYLVPKLLDAAKHRQDRANANNFLKKTLALQEALIDLRKDIRNVIEGGHSVQLPDVYRVELSDNEGQHPAGRFMISRGKLHHLEDYHGLLDAMIPEGTVNASTISKIHGLMLSPKFTVSEHPMTVEHLEQTAPRQVMITKLPEPKRPGVFSYFRPGMVRPHLVEFTPNGAALDGTTLSHDELGLMLQNARNGKAIIKWGGDEALQKKEPGAFPYNWEDGSIMDIDEALQHVRAAVAAGILSPSVERSMTRHIYEDDMIPGVGNKRAATKFREQGRPGVYASIDANSFKHINDTYGHNTGDDAIKSLGAALRTASQKTGTTKLFRPGGDEFMAWAPTHEDMARMLHHAREHVNALPPIAGQHCQSFSVGVGDTFDTADAALNMAKERKKDPITGQKLYHPGTEPNLGHSLLPGYEGPLFQGDESPPIVGQG
jgi:diguanylate cyclase (GGDEF)-like protein